MLEEKIKRIVEEPLKQENIEVIDVYFETKEGVKSLVIVIDKVPYVDMDTCVKATHLINPLLDKEDLIDDSYYLEVCSKGVEE